MKCVRGGPKKVKKTCSIRKLADKKIRPNGTSGNVGEILSDFGKADL